jgi:hypothetical protein
MMPALNETIQIGSILILVILNSVGWSVNRSGIRHNRELIEMNDRLIKANRELMEAYKGMMEAFRLLQQANERIVRTISVEVERARTSQGIQ